MGPEFGKLAWQSLCSSQTVVQNAAVSGKPTQCSLHIDQWTERMGSRVLGDFVISKGMNLVYVWSHAR